MSYEILKTIDFIDELRVDLDSVHPSKLQKLVDSKLIEVVDPGDGEPCFYMLSVAGAECWGAGVLAEEFKHRERFNVMEVDEILLWEQINSN